MIKPKNHLILKNVNKKRPILKLDESSNLKKFNLINNKKITSFLIHQYTFLGNEKRCNYTYEENFLKIANELFPSCVLKMISQINSCKMFEFYRLISNDPFDDFTNTNIFDYPKFECDEFFQILQKSNLCFYELMEKNFHLLLKRSKEKLLAKALQDYCNREIDFNEFYCISDYLRFYCKNLYTCKLFIDQAVNISCNHENLMFSTEIFKNVLNLQQIELLEYETNFFHIIIDDQTSRNINHTETLFLYNQDIIEKQNLEFKTKNFQNKLLILTKKHQNPNKSSLYQEKLDLVSKVLHFNDMGQNRLDNDKLNNNKITKYSKESNSSQIIFQHDLKKYDSFMNGTRFKLQI